MSFNVLILPKEDAIDVALAATTPLRVPADALVLHLFCDASFKRGSRIRGMKPRTALDVVGNIWLPLAITNERTTKGCFIPYNHRNDDSYTAEALALVEGACLALEKIASYEARSAIGPDDRVDIIFCRSFLAFHVRYTASCCSLMEAHQLHLTIRLLTCRRVRLPDRSAGDWTPRWWTTHGPDETSTHDRHD